MPETLIDKLTKQLLKEHQEADKMCVILTIDAMTVIAEKGTAMIDAQSNCTEEYARKVIEGIFRAQTMANQHN